MSSQPRQGGAQVALMRRQRPNAEDRTLKVDVPLYSTFYVRSSTFIDLTSATASPAIEQETREKEEVDLPWQVVVHNDPINLMTYVTMVFQKIFGFSREKAEKHMLEVHREGRSIVWSGLRERAELYVQQLHGYLLLATLERVN